MRSAALIPTLILVAGLSAPAGAEEQLERVPDGTVRFVSGSSSLTRRSLRRVVRVAAYLKQHPELTGLQVAGHTDDQGGEALNRKLSMGRAMIVREALIRAGVEPSRLRAVGKGSSEPLVSGRSKRARRLNRRVEILAPPHPVAFVARIQRRVEERDPKSTWRSAQERMPLRRLSQVRTHKRSSSEIQFPKDDKVRLGPNALVIIYGSPERTAARRQRVADIDVKGGSIFAELAEREGRSLAVRTGQTRMQVASKRTRIDVPDEDTATVSVFDGATQVHSQGKRVKVKKGYGTRVKKGKPPEKPRPLPPPPAWRTPGVQVQNLGAPLALAWTPHARSRQVELRVYSGPAKHPRLSRVLRKPRGDGLDDLQLQPGLHALRLVSVDERGISGPPSAPLRVLVLAPPSLDGEALKPPKHGKLTLSRPGRLRIPAPPGTQISADGAPGEAVELSIPPGEQVIGYMIQSGPVRVRRQLRVRAPTPKVQLTVAPPTLTKGRSATTLELAVTTPPGDVPFTGPLGVATPPGLSPALEQAPPTAELRPWPTAPAALTPMQALPKGRYRYTLNAPADGQPRPLRVYSAPGAMALDLALPVAQAAPSGPAHERGGAFFGLRLGALLSNPDGPSPSLGTEVGTRLPITAAWDASLRFGADWQRRDLGGDVVQVVPALAKAELGVDLSGCRLYFGAGGGLAFAAKARPAMGLVFGGLSYGLGHHELHLEVSQGFAGPLPRHRGEADIGGFGLTLGYRVGSWQLLH